MPAVGVRSVDGWWLESPFPTPNQMYGVWGTSLTDIWFVGDETILHYDGNTFRGVLGFGRSLRDVAGSGVDDVWALGDGLLRWNGTNWSTVAIISGFPLRKLWARTPTDAWIVGDKGTIQHWDGNAWTATPSGTIENLTGIYGFAADDVWAVGGTAVRHWNGAAWTDSPVTVPATMTEISAVWGADATDIWFAGNQFSHFDGAAFTVQATNTNAGTISLSSTMAIGTGKNCYRFGTSWTCPAVAQGTAVWGVGSTNFVTGNTAFQFLRKDIGGTSGESLVKSRATGTDVAWTGAADDVWVATGASVWRGTPGAWTPQSWGSTTSAVKGLSGTAANDVWITGTDGIVSHWDGNAFSPMAIASGNTTRVAARALDDAWVSIGSHGYHWDGAAWSDKGEITTQPLYAVWGSGADDAWATQTIGIVRHWNGTAWSGATDVFGGFSTASLWGSAPNAVVLATVTGRIARWNGAQWATVANDSGGPPFVPGSFWWASVDEGFAGTGSNRLVGHYASGGWRWETHGCRSCTVTAITGTSPQDVWAIGTSITGGFIAHRKP